MALEFHQIGFDGLGRKADDGLMWSDVTVSLRDTALDHRPSIRVSVPLRRNRASTLGELEEAARAYACEALRTALAILEGTTIQDLSERQAARDAEEHHQASQFDPCDLDLPG